MVDFRCFVLPRYVLVDCTGRLQWRKAISPPPKQNCSAVSWRQSPKYPLTGGDFGYGRLNVGPPDAPVVP